MTDILSLLSTFVGYVIIIASTVLEIPQIVAIAKARNAHGISLHTYLIDTFVFAITASWGIAHGLELADYGENLIIFGQIIVVDLMIGYYQQKLRVAFVGVGSILVLTIFLSTRMLPTSLHELLFGIRVGFIVVSKLPQLILTYQRRAMGSLSFATTLLSFLGGIVRVLTTCISVSWEQGKLIMAMGFGVSAILTGIIIVQFMCYGKVKGERSEVRTRMHGLLRLVGFGGKFARRGNFREKLVKIWERRVVLMRQRRTRGGHSEGSIV